MACGKGQKERTCLWWARQGSNLRPTGYEPAALPLSYGPFQRQLYIMGLYRRRGIDSRKPRLILIGREYQA